jgi:MoaA/NifB/PqqE/SkfB family radical SAM enzyme
MIFKIPFFWSNFYFGLPQILPVNYTLSLTFKCNSRCLTCNIWKKSGEEELTQAEWQKIFLSLGRSPYWVTLSGGEPFLRKDLTSIVENLCQICQPKIMTIPTNGLLSKKIMVDVKKMVENNPKTRFIINLSLDGVGEKHDEIRGVKGNFEAAMVTFSALKNLKHTNFTLGVHTVISQKNVEHVPQLTNFVLDKLKPDSYVTEVAENRVELGTMGIKITPSLEDYKEAIDYLGEKVKKEKLKGFSKLTRAFRSIYYDLVVKILEGKTQVISCYAGIVSAQIAPNGDVWPCCVRADVLGNLRQENYNFPKIWFSQKAAKVRKSIKNKKCWCPLANVSYTNALLHPPTMVRILKKLF